MEAITAALREQHHELGTVLAGLTELEWTAHTRCEGWDVLDVVLHLAQTDELASASLAGRFDRELGLLAEGLPPSASVDAGAADLVAKDRATTSGSTEVLARWRRAAEESERGFADADPHARLRWVSGELAARTLATTRLAEAWIHTGDVVDALGLRSAPSDRLRPIARLAWRTLPHAFAAAGQDLTGPVAFHLLGPNGDRWDFVPEEPAVTTIRGPAADLCEVAARRRDPAATDLETRGPDGRAVLALVRTYA